MPPLQQPQLGSLAEAGPHAPELLGEPPANHQRFHHRQNRGPVTDHVRLGPDLAGHRQEDAVDLRLLLLEEPDQFIVLLNGFQRLDVHGLPARTRSVDDSRNPPFRLRLDGNHKPLAANGDQFVLDATALRQPPQRLPQALLDLPLLPLDLAPNPVQVGRRVVGQRPVGQHPPA